MLSKRKTIGEYSIGRTIGQGAFSKVKIGYNKITKEEVAIKIINKKQLEEKNKKTQENKEIYKKRREHEEFRKKKAIEYAVHRHSAPKIECDPEAKIDYNKKEEVDGRYCKIPSLKGELNNNDNNTTNGTSSNNDINDINASASPTTNDANTKSDSIIKNNANTNSNSYSEQSSESSTFSSTIEPCDIRKCTYKHSIILEEEEELSNENSTINSNSEPKNSKKQENITTTSTDNNATNNILGNNELKEEPQDIDESQDNDMKEDGEFNKKLGESCNFNPILHANDRKFSVDSSNRGIHTSNNLYTSEIDRKFSLDSNQKNHAINNTEDVCTPLKNLNNGSNSEKSSNSSSNDDNIFLKDHSVIPLPSYYERLQNEVQLMMRLDHPNIIKIYQVIESEDETLIVMEYAPGGELIDYILTKKHLNETEARKFFRQIISAIDHCHMANVVHRDLKLENLLLSKDKNILITDFGLGRTFDGSTKDYMTTFCGTPNYAAIELISGIPYIGVKSDIWALGVILYVMMTGKPPFDGKSINALYRRIKKIDYKIPSYFSKDLAKLLEKIFVKDPEKRASINDLRDDPWVNYEEVEKPIRIFPVNAQEMEQIVSGITKGNGYVSYIFREPSSSPKKKESNLNLAISQNSINDCLLLNNERRKSNVVDEIMKRKMNNSSSKSPISPESLKSPFRSMTGCEIPNMDIWGGVLVDSTLSQKIYNKKYSSLMESGNKGLIDNVKNDEDYHSVSDIAHLSNKNARNRHFLRLNTNVGYSQSVINSASVDERPSINPRYYSIVNISERNKSNNSSEDSVNSSCDIIDSVKPLKSYSKSVSQITDESLYRNNSTRLNNKSGLGKVKAESKQNKEIRRSNSFGFASFLNKKKNTNNIVVNVAPSVEGNTGNPGPISPLNPNHPSSFSETHKRSNSAFSIPIVTKPINQNNKPKTNIPSPLKMESKVISKSINISSTTSSKNSSPSEILADSFDMINDSNSPDDDAIPNYHEIEMWHLIHKPSKTIRSTRLNFNKSTATSKPPFSLFQNLCWALYELKNVYENRFYFARNSDYYLFECNLLNEDFNNVDVKFEVEVCKVWLLKIYALRFKRISGDPFIYEKLYSELISLLRADEDKNNENSLKDGKIPISNEVTN